MNRKVHSASIKRMPRRMISVFMYASRFSRVDHDDAFVMLDSPGVYGQPFGPLLVEEHIRDAGEPCAARLHLCTAYLHQAGTNRMNDWHGLLDDGRVACDAESARDFTLRRRPVWRRRESPARRHRTGTE